MSNQVNKDYSHTAKRRIVIEMINAGFRLAEKIGPHPLTNGCNCIDCVHKRKRITKMPKTGWRFRL